MVDLQFLGTIEGADLGKFEKMQRVIEACADAGIAVPPEAAAYENSFVPEGIADAVVKDFSLDESLSLNSTQDAEVWTIDLKRLPAGIEKLLVVLKWE